jgi:hypothetical protein
MSPQELYDLALRNSTSPRPTRVRVTTRDGRTLDGVPTVGSVMPHPGSSFMMHVTGGGKVRLTFGEVAGVELA